MQIRAKIKPKSKKGPLIIKINDDNGEFFEIYVREPAINGMANLAVIKILSEHFKVAKNRITIKSGSKSQFKTFKIDS